MLFGEFMIPLSVTLNSPFPSFIILPYAILWFSVFISWADLYYIIVLCFQRAFFLSAWAVFNRNILVCAKRSQRVYVNRVWFTKWLYKLKLIDLITLLKGSLTNNNKLVVQSLCLPTHSKKMFIEVINKNIKLCKIY